MGKKFITELILCDNVFGPEGVRSLQPFLEQCATLKILDITNCGVGPKGG